MWRVLFVFMAFVPGQLCLPTHVQAFEARVAVCFTPGEDCEGAIVQAIGGARSQVLVQAYAFSSRPILDALQAALRRNVEVLVIVDRREGREAAARLTAAGIPVWIDSIDGTAHAKVMVIDSARVVTGSYNFTWSAAHRNVENLIVIDSPEIAVRFAAQWQARFRLAVPYAGPARPAVAVSP